MHNGRGLGAVLLISGALTLGCSGLFGYGEELGDAQARSGQPFKFEFTASSEPDAEHKLWLIYDLEHSRDYSVGGTLDLKQKKGASGSWTLDLTDDGSPIQGGKTRFTMNSRSTSVGGKGSASATIYLTELPKLAPGSKARVTGTITAGPGTTLKSARVVVTD